MKHVTFLGCKYPIVAVAMNRVSDVTLAVACHKAGIFPSISSFNYYENGLLGIEAFINDLKRYIDLAGSTNVLLSMSPQDLFAPEVLKFLIQARFASIELFKWNIPERQWEMIVSRAEILSTKYGFRFFFKIHRRQDVTGKAIRTVIFKGNDGAGRSDPEAGSLEDNFNYVRQARPEVDIIPSGGIATADQVKHYMEKGALAVGIGTLFAASEESCISIDTKKKMIEATADSLEKFGKFNQQGLVFSRLAADDANNTRSLALGISQADAGLVFAGKGIEHVKRILPVAEIVSMLVADIVPQAAPAVPAP